MRSMNNISKLYIIGSKKKVTVSFGYVTKLCYLCKL